MVIEFTIPGEPKGKGRPRLGRSGHAYTPHDTATYENLVKVCFMQEFPNHAVIPAGVPVSVGIRAYYPIPKSTSKRNRLAIAMGHLLPLKKPDLDNIMKIVCDALNGIAWHDDSQIVYALVAKYYGAEPKVTVRIKWDESDGTEEQSGRTT